MYRFFLLLVSILLLGWVGCSSIDESDIEEPIDKTDEEISIDEAHVEYVEVPIDANNNAQILFTTNDCVVIGNPQINNADSSYSMQIQKYDFKSQKMETIGSLDYVGVFSNDYIYIDDSQIYGCFSYDKNFYPDTNDINNKIRIVKFDVEKNNMEVVYEFESVFSVIYVEPIDKNMFLLYDTGKYNAESNQIQSSVSLYDVDSQSLSTIFTQNSTQQKPLAATFSDDLIYILVEINNSYVVEAYDLNLKKAFDISLDEISYFLQDDEGKLNSVQHIYIKGTMCNLTLFGSTSIVFDFDQTSQKLTEKYIGSRLIPWDAFSQKEDIVKFYSTGQACYEINYDAKTVSEIDVQSEMIDLSIYYSISTFNGDQFILYTITDNIETKGLNKTYYYLPQLSAVKI